nr:MAG TPA: hypothetical protein [Caudoviricetes sp.]
MPSHDWQRGIIAFAWSIARLKNFTIPAKSTTSFEAFLGSEATASDSLSLERVYIFFNSFFLIFLCCG